MRLKTRNWVIISLLSFVGAFFFWRLGEQRVQDQKRKDATPTPASSSNSSSSKSNLSGMLNVNPAFTGDNAAHPGLPKPNVAAVNTQTNLPFPFRLANTTKPIDELTRSDNAILLRNALIDVTGAALSIPDQLRSKGDPGRYIVQARGKITDSFREQLRQADAQIVSYVPNNAYLVQISEAGANKLQASPETQTVLPWEPYYKLSPMLLAAAVKQENLPDGSPLNVLVFPGEAQNARAAFEQLGILITGQDRSPFGQQLFVRIPGNALSALAQLRMVQAIELHRVRTPANDLARARVRVSTNTTTATNYRGLDGTGVLVNINDTGIDGTHPDLSPRITGDTPNTLIDLVGHGTHVAGIIGSSGANGPDGNNVRGSTNGANFRGKAPAVKIHVLPIDEVIGPIGDSYLQEGAAGTNAFISNNSWGYPGEFDYSISSASWDASVRDALPGITGEQPLLSVFAAGNSGSGDDERNGKGGSPDSVLSPGNAKNIISVGAIESYRRISNNIVIDGVTNMAFYGSTDSSNQVASFSSRGNVGIGVEGRFGRFKPDVVAPGTFVVSTRPVGYLLPQGGTNFAVNLFTNITLAPHQTNLGSIFVPPDGYQLRISVLTNLASPSPFPGIQIGIRQGAAPDGINGTYGVNDLTVNVTSDNWFFSYSNPNKQPVTFHLRTILVTTNNPGNYYSELASLDAELKAPYGYDSGTSMAAPAVTGVLALMQQGFNQILSNTNPSPALFKALLINGARSVNSIYDFKVNSLINYQGWGLVNITNSFPESLQSGASQTSGGLLFFDRSNENPIEVLSTGQSHTRNISLSSSARRVSLRVTLVWTDPPGNPSVGTKLVNDLDLVVTNLDSGEVYVGNNFGDGSVFTSAFSGGATNSTNIVLAADNINNVENVFIQSTIPKPLGTNFSITVKARRVDVNAVTTVPDGIVQDYALVIASENPTLVSGITLGTDTIAVDEAPRVTLVTNGMPLLNQRAGANSPYLVSTNGNTNQWKFFVFINQNDPGNTNIVAGPYVAFHTFLPPNLSLPRTSGEADIDMYVARGAAGSTITNLDSTAIATATRGVKRSGTETTIFTNSFLGEVFYVGVKSEDQQGANFGFFAVSSVDPFSSTDEDGNIIATAVPAFVDIPDGTTESPQAALVFAFVMDPVIIDNVIVTNVITHDSGGDLLGNLSHDNNFVVLNNHNGFNGTVLYVYDDSDSGEILISQPSFGPGSLRSFIGQPGEGAWQLTMVDNSQFHTGRVDRLVIKIRPQPTDLGTGIIRRILPNRWTFTSTNVPPDATKLEVCVAPSDGPVEVYIRRDAVPDRSNYDAFARIGVPGDCLSITRFDSPPLSQGLYIIGVYNPNSTPEDVRIRVNVERNLGSGQPFRYSADGTTPFLDDATTNSSIFVDRRQLIADVSVGVRIDHPRVADLSLHLVSPSGTRILLFEDRGGPSATNLGASTPFVTNVFPVSSSGGDIASSNILDLAQSFGTLEVDYQFYGIPDDMHVYYDDALIFDSGLVSGQGRFSIDFGPGFSTNILIVMNEGDNPDPNTAWDYTASVITGGHTYLNFTENTNLAHLPIKFASPPFTTNLNATNILIVTPLGNFEASPAGDYLPPAVVDGWTVVTNGVTIVNDPARAFMSNQFLGLADGVLAHPLATIPGAQYRVRYSYHSQCITALWDAEETGVDAINANTLVFSSIALTQGVSGMAFQFNGTNADANALASPSLDIGASSNLTVECWIKPSDITVARTLFEWSGSNALAGVTIGLLPGGAVNVDLRDNLGLSHTKSAPAGLVDTNLFHHIAVTYSIQDNTIRIYIDGVERATQIDSAFRPNTTNDFFIGVSPASGVNSHYLGAMDDIGLYNCALSHVEIKAIYNAGLRNQGKCDEISCYPFAEIAVDGLTNSIRTTATTDWRFGIFEFTAATNTATLSLIGGVNSVLFDSFELLQKPSDPALYYLPEEPLAPLLGQNAYGEWRLEAWDTRLNAVLTNGEIVSWKLNLSFVNTNLPGTILTNGQCFSGVLGGSNLAPEGSQTNSLLPNTAYFIIDVPVNAGHATNSLISSNSPLNLLYSTSGLPAGQFYRRANRILTNTVDGTAIVGRGGAVEYDGGTLVASNGVPRLQPGRRYYLAVENLSTNSTGFTLCVNFDQFDDILLNTIPLINQVPYTNTVAFTNLLDYYHFDASSNAVELIFEILNPSENVDLFVRHGLPLPNTSSYDPPPGQNPGTNNEQIFYIDAAGTLLGGRWYLGVANMTNLPVTYTVRVTEILGIDPIVLTNAVPFTNTVTATNVDYYRYTISSNSYRADFEVLNPSGNVDLYISTTRFPPPSQQFNRARSENPGATPEFISLYTNGTPALTPGNWYLAVTNKSGAPVTYQVRVTEYKIPPIIPLTNAIPYSSAVQAAATARIDLYSFIVSTNAIEAMFELFDLSGNADLYVARSVVDALNQTNGVANVQPGTNSEIIVLLPSSVPVALTPGVWYLSVSNADVLPVSYTVRATEILASSIVRLTNAVGFTNTVPAAGLTNSGIDYYVFTISTNGYQANFETLAASGNVDLFVSKGLPLPTTNSPLASQNLAATNELIIVRTNLAPVPLAPGDWYLAVVNRDAVPVTYTVRATELDPPPIIRLTNAIAFTNTIPAPNGTTNLGVQYYVFTVSNNAVEAQFQTFSTAGNVDLYLRPAKLPTETNFVYASTNLFPTNEFIAVATNSITPLTPGDWYLAVYSRETTNVDYAVRATQFLAADIITLTNCLSYTTSITASNGSAGGGISYFHFVVPAGALQANFEILNPSGNVDLYVRQGLPLPNRLNYYYSSVNSGTANELVAVTNGAPIHPLAPGDWYLAVINNEAGPVTYTVAATAYLPGVNLISLTNAVVYNASGVSCPAGTIDYYVYTVSGTAVRAQFEVLSPSEDVNLVLRKGLPLPNGTSFDYRSANTTTNDELITVLNTSTPPLTPGDWYLGVVRTSGNPVTYSVKATEFNTPGTNLIITSYALLTNSLCLTWTNTLPGVHYFVQGKVALTDTNWSPVSPTLTAVTTSQSYCIPLPNANQFFRIAEGLANASTAGGGGSFGLKLTKSVNAATLNWIAPSNQNFRVQWSPSIAPSVWNSFPGMATSTNINYQFQDDGSQSGGLGAARFYQIVPVP